MSTKALGVVQEFLRADEPQLRRNALTALAILGSAESVRLLLDAALHDPDAAVRERAEREIAGLPGPAMEVVVRLLHEAMGRVEHRKSAYALASRLTRRGERMPRFEQPAATRFRLAWGNLTGWRMLSRRFGLVAKASAAGAFLGAVLLVALWASAEGGVDLLEAVTFAAVAVVPSAGMSILATIRSSPAVGHPDRGGGAAADVVAAALGALPVGVITGVALFVSEGGVEWTPALAGALAPIVAAVATRVATLISYGSQEAALADRIFAASTGAVTGLFAFTAVLVASGVAPLGSVSTAWALLLPSVVAMSWAFATLDHPDRGSPWRGDGNPRGFVLPVVSLLAVVMIAADEDPADMLSSSRAQLVDTILPITAVPQDLMLVIDGKRAARFEVIENPALLTDNVVLLSEPAPETVSARLDRNTAQRADDPPCLEGTIDPGTYLLRVEPYFFYAGAWVDPTNVLPKIVGDRFIPTMAAESGLALKVRLEDPQLVNADQQARIERVAAELSIPLRADTMLAIPPLDSMLLGPITTACQSLMAP